MPGIRSDLHHTNSESDITTHNNNNSSGERLAENNLRTTISPSSAPSTRNLNLTEDHNEGEKVDNDGGTPQSGTTGNNGVSKISTTPSSKITSLEKALEDPPTSASASVIANELCNNNKNTNKNNNSNNHNHHNEIAGDPQKCSHSNDNDTTEKEKVTKISTPKPKRSMILTGAPPPALPPKPEFPTELENFQNQASNPMIMNTSPEYNTLISQYIHNLKKDYEKQLQDYEKLSSSIQKDTFFNQVIVDTLDALDEDPFTLDSFEHLMRLHAAKNKDFILARVTTQDPNDESKLYHSYYGAHQINKVLFRTQPDEGLLHRMKARNVSNYDE
jgi:hypothetical protein